MYMALTTNFINSHYYWLKNHTSFACCKVLGLISKLITSPLWRLIEKNMHVLDMNSNYHQLLIYLERMSENANDFITGDECPFPIDLIEKDEAYDKLVQPEDNIDVTACAFAQMAFKALANVLRKAMKEQLPGRSYYDVTDDMRHQTKSVIPHNNNPERVFGIQKNVLDFFLRYRPNASTVSNEAYLMFVFNKTSQWLEKLDPEERDKMLTEGIKQGRDIRVKYRERLKEIDEKRKEKLKEKQIALEKKKKCSEI